MLKLLKIAFMLILTLLLGLYINSLFTYAKLTTTFFVIEPGIVIFVYLIIMFILYKQTRTEDLLFYTIISFVVSTFITITVHENGNNYLDVAAPYVGSNSKVYKCKDLNYPENYISLSNPNDSFNPDADCTGMNLFYGDIFFFGRTKLQNTKFAHITGIGKD